jgi:hypothetical protein
MPLLRISEPFFFNVIKENIKTLTAKFLCRYEPSVADQPITLATFTNKDSQDSSSTILNTAESFSEELDDPPETAPVFLFLASSLNVELVYSILKGITQFGYLTLCDPLKVAHKLKKMNINETEEDLQITLYKIKIKGSRTWEYKSDSFDKEQKGSVDSR